VLPDSFIEAEKRLKTVTPLGTGSPLGFGPFGEAPPIPANDQGSSLSRSVSADLEQIFADLPAEDLEAPPRRPRVQSVDKPAGAAEGGGAARMGAIAAGVLAAIALGFFFVKPNLPTKTASPPPPPAATAVPTAADLRAPLPVVVDPLPEPEQAEPVAPVEIEAAPPKKTKAVRPPRSAKASKPPSRSEVMAADRRLRRAYAAADHAGVSRAALVAARNRWVALRGRDPAKLLPGYIALAEDLEAKAQAAGGKKRKRSLFG
jgi:hypothetical protein